MQAAPQASRPLTEFLTISYVEYDEMDARAALLQHSSSSPKARTRQRASPWRRRPRPMAEPFGVSDGFTRGLLMSNATL